jgi:hypothetical protein
MSEDVLVGLPEAVRRINDPAVTVTSLLAAIREGRLLAQDDETRPGRKLVTVAAVRQMLDQKPDPEPEPEPDRPIIKGLKKKVRLRK